MKVPTVHLNGTGKEMLVTGYQAALRSLRDAEKALSEVEFNARDYYVQGHDAWPEAVKEMEARFKAIRKVENEIQQILAAID
jgi:hypothetical protein